MSLFGKRQKADPPTMQQITEQVALEALRNMSLNQLLALGTLLHTDISVVQRLVEDATNTHYAESGGY